MDLVTTLGVPLLLSFVLSVVLIPVMIFFAKKNHFVDDPKKHQHPGTLHTKPVPRGGGLPLYLAIIITCFIILPLDKSLIMIILGGLVTVVTGLLDDLFDLSPYPRLISNFIVASLPVIGGVSIHFITNPFGIGAFSILNTLIPFGFFGNDPVFLFTDLVTIIWIVWTMNMLNWSSGLDGQMPGIAAISALVIGVLSLRFAPLDSASIQAAQLSFITAGVCLGFLVYNFHPAKIFPGDSGMIIGFMLAVVSILSGAKLATALLVMAVPTLDGVFTIVRRITTGKSPFKSDRGHFHHLLLKRGLTVPQVAILYWVLSAGIGGIALFLNSKQKFFAFIVLAVVVFGALLWLSLFSKKESEE